MSCTPPKAACLRIIEVHTSRLLDCQSTITAAAVGSASAESALNQGLSSRPQRVDCPCRRRKLMSSDGPETSGRGAPLPAGMGMLGT